MRHCTSVKTLERDGARIGYEVSGDGPALVLGHAVPCDHRMWQSVLPALARHYRVIAIDVRGHGASTAPGRFSTASLVDDWLAVLDAEGIARAALVGSSIGGMTAIELAARAPERVGALVLVGTSAEQESLGRRVLNRVLLAIAGLLGPVGSFERKLELDLFAARTRRERPDVVRQVLAWARSHDWRSFLRALRAIAARPSLLPLLPRIRCPALIVAGAEDRRMPPARAERIAAGIAEAEVRVVAETGHLVPLEAPEAWLGAVLPFLDRHWPARSLPESAR
jgi:pimeloyl-ACP methyl ester carboxylesterase